jgi:hypothetical protein
VAIFSTLLQNTINSKVLSIAQNSTLRVITSQTMQQFTSLIILKAEVASYAFVFEVAAFVIMIGSFAAFLINVPKEATAHGHVVIGD